MEASLIPLKVFDGFPGDLKGLKPPEVRKVFDSPSLVEIKGRRKQPLLISTLLHGNETTSFYILQKLQEYLKVYELPRSVVLFVGNVFAAEEEVRFLPGQSDYNRIWDGGESSEHQLAEAVKSHVLIGEGLFASVDIHNNTGMNPFYSCVSSLEDPSIYLSSLFSRTLVYFKSPQSAQSVVFTDFCPAVTLECGKSGTPMGVEKAFNFILDVLHLETLNHPVLANEIDIYQTTLRLVVKPDIEFSFGGSSPLVFRDNFERLNFTKLEEGEKLADFFGTEPPFAVNDINGEDRFEDYFTIKDHSIRLKKRVIPSMFTKNKDVIRQDCLGYLMRSIVR